MSFVLFFWSHFILGGLNYYVLTSKDKCCVHYFGVYMWHKQHHCVQRCSFSVSVLTSVISLYTVISHISCSSGVCGRRPVNFPHAVLIGPTRPPFQIHLQKKWWLSFHLSQNGASFCSQHPQEMISVREGSSHWFCNRKR